MIRTMFCSQMDMHIDCDDKDLKMPCGSAFCAEEYRFRSCNLFAL